MDAFFDLFDGLPRQGPGSNALTRQALQMILHLPRAPAILDVGCGTGMQTLELARCTQGRVVAVDNHQPYLDLLHQRAHASGLAKNIEIVNACMDDLPLAQEQFDLIWSEGAIYIMGFAEGLGYWRQFLKGQGYVAVSELTWLTENPHREATQFWEVEYPQITTMAANLRTIASTGYDCLGHFVLPASAWWDHYYSHLLPKIQPFREKHAEDPEALAIADGTAMEIDLHRKYNDDYGYVFYVMQVRH